MAKHVTALGIAQLAEMRRFATPYLRVDLDVVRANVRAMAAWAAQRGLALRPHFKTHKSIGVAKLQAAAGAQGFSCATLGEAEVLATAGFDDLFLAYPIWASGGVGSRLRRLADNVDLIVGVDSLEGAASLRAAIGQAQPLSVAIEIDCGCRRSGVRPDRTHALAHEVRKLGLKVVGIFCYPGQGYLPEAGESAARAEASALEQAHSALAAEGWELAFVSAGSTPTVRHTGEAPVTEVRPGTYVYGDRQQIALGSMLPEDIAAVVIATVVSTAVAGQFVIDAGAKILGRDRPRWLADNAALVPPSLGAVSRLYDHHGIVECSFSERPEVGAQVALIPNNINTVVNLVDYFVVTNGGRAVRTWRVDARGK